MHYCSTTTVPHRLFPMATALTALLAALSLPALAAHPARSAVAMPQQQGGQTLSRWSGTIPAQRETGAHCLSTGRFDAHRFEPLLTKAGDSQADVRMTVSVTATGASAGQTDLAVTILRPDGRAQTGDTGGPGVAESVAITNPAAGLHEIRTCAVAGAAPQHYTAELKMVATRRPEKAAFYENSSDSACQAPELSLKFEQDYIDTSRAGGEPFIFKHPDGHLLWGSHAGTSHFYSPAAPSPGSAPFVENYTGQTYYYFAEASTGFTEWTFVPRIGPGPGDVAPLAGLPATGFSDPEFAVDSAGNVFVSEINLANVAVSKSTDGGRSYGLQNVFSLTGSDRQWMAADREDELYIAASGFGGGPFPGRPAGELGHYLAKSSDGGVTFGAPLAIDPLVGDIQIDKQRGILYSLHEAGGTVAMARFPNIRDEETNFTVEILPIAEGAGMAGVQRLIDPTFDLDREGNLYVTWYENGQGARPQGVYYAYSTDQGDHWSKAQRVDHSEEDEVWPWIAVGEPGQVAISWLQTDLDSADPLPGEAGSGTVTDRLQASPNKPWHVVIAHSSSGLGCTDTAEGFRAEIAAFTISQATSEPPHTGTICQGGTLCQAQVIDRRLGDYFSIEVANDGTVHVAVSDTRQGGAVALPLHVRQIGGPVLLAPAEPTAEPTPTPSPTAIASREASVPARGGALSLASLWLALLLGWRRRRY